MLPYLVICSCHLFASVLKKVYITSHEINTFPPHKKKPNTKGYKKYLHHTIVTSRKETYILWIWETSTPNPPCYETNSVFSQHQSVMSLHSEIFSQGLPVRKRYLFSYLHLTTLAFSRLEAMRTTQGNKLMRGDLWKGEWERKKDRFFSAAPSFLFVLLLLPFSSLGSIASALKSRSSHQMTKTLL